MPRIGVAQPEEEKDPEALAAWGPRALYLRNVGNRQHQSAIARTRADWIRKNDYYYRLLTRLLRHIIEPGRRVLNLRCQTGLFLSAVSPCSGVGVDISAEMIAVARSTHPQFTYVESLPEDFSTLDKFDYVLLCDVGDIVDVQKTLVRIKSACDRQTRLVIYSYNHLWEPVLELAQTLGLKIPQPQQNWLSEQDLIGLLSLTGFEWLKTYRTALVPKYVPLISGFANRIVAKLPLLNRLCMIQVIVARLVPEPVDPSALTVSVIVPCKDEKGNIEDAVKRTPELGRKTELIFCDDKSTDGTPDEVRRMQKLYPNRLIRLVEGPGVCKSKNVWTGV